MHLAGAVATFVGVGAWFFAALSVRRLQRVEDIRSLALVYEMGGVLAFIGIVVVAAGGLYLALTFWSLQVGWIQVAIGAFALMAPVGPLVVAPRLERLMQAARAAGDGPLSSELMARARDPVPKVGLLLIIGDLAGIVFVMTVKPSFAGSVLAVVVFTGVGAVLSLPAVGRLVFAGVEAFARLEQSSPLYRR